LWLLSPLVLTAIFAPLLASNVPFFFHDARQTVVFDTADATPVFQDVGTAVPLERFRADALAAAAEADKIKQAEEKENEDNAPKKDDAAATDDPKSDATGDEPEETSADPSSEESELDLSILKKPETEVEKIELELEKAEQKLAESPDPWVFDGATEQLWVRRGGQVFVHRHVPEQYQLDTATPLMVLTAVDRQPQVPGRITNIDWFRSADQAIILRDGNRTLIFHDVPAPKIEAIEAASEDSQQTQQTQQTADDAPTDDDAEAAAPTGPEFPLQFTQSDDATTLVFEVMTGNQDAQNGDEESDATNHFRLTYNLSEPTAVTAGTSAAFTRTMSQFPWFRTLLNPGASVDYMFNIAMICFFPMLILGFFIYRFWRGKEVSGRLAAVRLTGIYFLVIIAVAIFFSFDATSPSNKWKERTFTAEAYNSSYMKWGVYPLIPFGPAENDAGASEQPPGFAKPRYEMADSNDSFPHILGTDSTGADTLTRMIYGSRISLSVGIVAVGIYMTIGIIIGAIAGYFGGWVDLLLSRCIEVVMLFPALFLVLTIVALYGKSIYVVMVVIGITGWPGIARLTRGEVLKQRQIEYVTAARALGGSNFRIIFRHILPNALSPAMVAAPFGIAGAIITEAGLSLLGFGAEPSEPTWGNLLNIANSNYSLWWLIIFPTIAIFATVTLLNLIGNGLRDAMDPRLRR